MVRAAERLGLRPKNAAARKDRHAPMPSATCTQREESGILYFHTRGRRWGRTRRLRIPGRTSVGPHPLPLFQAKRGVLAGILQPRGFAMRWGSAFVVVLLCVGASAIAKERTVFSYRDADSKSGCFVQLSGKDWVELAGNGQRRPFQEIDRRDNSITLAEQGQEGLTVRLCADKAERKTQDAALGNWAPLWSGGWTTNADLRSELRERGLWPVRQGRRGTCSVFTTASALELAFSRYTGKNVRLSVEYLNWAANQVTGHPSDGQYFHNCLAGFDKYGICYNADMPYARTFDAKLRRRRRP